MYSTVHWPGCAAECYAASGVQGDNQFTYIVLYIPEIFIFSTAFPIYPNIYLKKACKILLQYSALCFLSFKKSEQ